jgi:septum formation protein
MSQVPLILASKSPRRKQLLEMAEVPFEILTFDTDESWPEGMPVDAVPEFIAANKGLAVAAAYPDRDILAADTVVVLDDQIIGKPGDRDDALHILGRLSGRRHRVITGVYLYLGGQEFRFSDTTEVEFHSLSPEQIGYYVDHYKPYDKAGAYAIQEWIGVVGIRRIDGCFYNVMGLPISRVLDALNKK